MTQIRVVIFDCDGVLFDTEKANRMYYDDLLAHLGRPPMTDEQFAYAQMHTVEEVMKMLFPDPKGRADAEKYRKSNGYTPYIRYMEMAPGLKDVLGRLRKNLSTAIATNRTDTMSRVLAIHGLEPYFDFVVTALDVESPKPAPDPLFRVMEHFSIRPGEMIYVGDSSLDEQAAKASGVRFVAFCNPDLDADFHVDSMAGLEKLVSGLGN